MGQPVARRLDHGTHDGFVGQILSGKSKMKVGGMEVATDGDQYICGHPDHYGYYTLNELGTSEKLIIGGKRAARIGSKATCGAAITEGSSKLMV